MGKKKKNKKNKNKLSSINQAALSQKTTSQLDPVVTPIIANSDLPPNATIVTETKEAHAEGASFNSFHMPPSYSQSNTNNTKIVIETIDTAHVESTLKQDPIQPTSQLDDNTSNSAEVKNQNEPTPTSFVSENDGNTPSNESSSQVIDPTNNDQQNHPEETATEISSDNIWEKMKKSYGLYSTMDMQPKVWYDSNGILHINQYAYPPTFNNVQRNTKTDSNANINNEDAASNAIENNNTISNALNCYENFTPSIKLFEKYEKAEQIVEAFEKVFHPRVFGNDLIIWENGVDKPLTNDNLKAFIKSNFFLSLHGIDKPSSIVKTCCELINYNAKTKYQKYYFKKDYILAQNGHFNINFEVGVGNPKIFDDGCDINDISCKYRLNASIKLPDYPNFSLIDFVAPAPVQPLKFDKFLCDISCNVPAVITRIWQMIGFLITPDTKSRAIFIMQGEPASGKSLLGKIIARLFDSEYVANLSVSQLGNKSVAKKLMNKQINISLDLPNDTIPPESISFLKQMTGGDVETKSPFTEEDTHIFGNCKFLFATNHPLIIKGIDTAFTERIVTIPFKRSISPLYQNPNLYEELEKEIDYIAAKALYYYHFLVMANNLFVNSGHDYFKPNIVTLGSATDEANTIMKTFFETACITGPYKIYTYELFNAYKSFCQFNGFLPIEKMNSFSRVFKKCFEDKVVSGKWRMPNSDGLNGFRGVTLKGYLNTPNLQMDEEVGIYFEKTSFDQITNYDNNS